MKRQLFQSVLYGWLPAIVLVAGLGLPTELHARGDFATPPQVCPAPKPLPVLRATNLPTAKAAETKEEEPFILTQSWWIDGKGECRINYFYDPKTGDRLERVVLWNERVEGADGKLSGNTITVPGWGIRGLVTTKGPTSTIHWSNGSCWSRSDIEGGFGPGSKPGNRCREVSAAAKARTP